VEARRRTGLADVRTRRRVAADRGVAVRVSLRRHATVVVRAVGRRRLVPRSRHGGRLHLCSARRIDGPPARLGRRAADLRRNVRALLAGARRPDLRLAGRARARAGRPPARSRRLRGRLRRCYGDLGRVQTKRAGTSGTTSASRSGSAAIRSARPTDRRSRCAISATSCGRFSCRDRGWQATFPCLIFSTSGVAMTWTSPA
jgi:hypothetical protein